MADEKQKIIWTYAWPLSRYHAAYIDIKKSLPHMTPEGPMENLNGLPYWIPLQRYLTGFNDYIDAISEIDFDEHIISDPVTNLPLLRFRVEKGKSAIYDGQQGNGMLLLEYTQYLRSYRKRDDGLLGIEGKTKGLDTRLSKAEYLKNPGKFADTFNIDDIQKTNSKEANFTNLVELTKEPEEEGLEEL